MSHDYQILTLNRIASEGLVDLSSPRYQLGSDLTQPDAVILRSFDMHAWPLPDSVQAIGRAGAGVNNIPVAEMSARGIPVFNAPGANANAVKELVLAGLLMSCRNVLPACRYVEQLQGDKKTFKERVEKGKKRYIGCELPGRVLGVVGLGAIGVQLCNTALALGMRVIGYDPQITVQSAWRLSAEVEPVDRVEQMLPRLDFLSLHVPLMDSTHHFLAAERLRLMRPDAVVLNFSRDQVVDVAALVDALRGNRLRRYVCDFPTPELVGQEGVIALPHLGASTVEAERDCARMVAQQLRDYLEHGTVKNAVNLPTLALPRKSKYRLAVVHCNRPGMVADISQVLASKGLNIVHMVNESRADLAYTLMDLDRSADSVVLAAIAAVEGVLRWRFLPAEE